MTMHRRRRNAKRGLRLRARVCPVSLPILNDPGTELTVELAGTSIELPVVGGTEAYERTVD